MGSLQGSLKGALGKPLSVTSEPQTKPKAPQLFHGLVKDLAHQRPCFVVCRGSGFRGQGLGFRVQDSGFRVWGSGRFFLGPFPTGVQGLGLRACFY